MRNTVPRDLFIGLDLGTSGCRAIAIDAAARPVAEARAAWPAPQRQGPAVEQSPAVWWTGARTVLQHLLKQLEPQRIAALAVDGTSGTLLYCDPTGQPLGPALMYNDARAIPEAAQVARVAPVETAARGPSATLAKLLWLHTHRPPAPPHHTLHQADWLVGCLTGRYDTTDANNALKLGYDPLSGGWPDWLETLGVDRAGLPGVVEPATPLGPVRDDVAAGLGLPGDVLVVAGTTDSTAAFLATGARHTGDAVTSLGSTLVLKIIADRPVFDPDAGVYSQPQPICGASPGTDTPPRRWLVGGGSNTGGTVLRQFFSDAELRRLTPRLQADTPSGLDYYPLPAPGERFPVCDPGLAPRLTPRPEDDARFLQGLFEGMARIEAEGYRRLTALGAPTPRTVYTVGGGASNTAWTAIRARTLGMAPCLPPHQEAAYGSALLAREGHIRHGAAQSRPDHRR